MTMPSGVQSHSALKEVIVFTVAAMFPTSDTGTQKGLCRNSTTETLESRRQ